MSGPARFG